MKPAQQIGLWADQLRDLSAMGLHFCKNMYDRASYETIQRISMQMTAAATGLTADQIEPLRGTVFARPTPLAVGDAAIIDDRGRMLLIQRADNHKWAMPGGALEVGETPAHGVVREALEETGVHCRAVRAGGVFDSRLCGTVAPFHMYQFVFLCVPDTDAPVETPSHAAETLGCGWFAEGELPAELDPGHRSRIPEAFRAWHGRTQAYFDQ